MACKCKRYDAWGNLILPHLAMLAYYKDDPESLKILRSSMAHRFVVIPNVEIRVLPAQPERAVVWLIYPGGTVQNDLMLSARAVDALRRTYRGKPGWTHAIDKYGWCVFRKVGRVILETAGKYSPKG